jgi:molybdate transport system substrate-binding protein
MMVTIIQIFPRKAMSPVYTRRLFGIGEGRNIVKAIGKLQTIQIVFILAAISASAFAHHFPFAWQGGTPPSSLRAYTSDGFEGSLQALLPQIEHSVGRKISPEFDSSKVLERKIQAGEPFDVAILSSNVIDELIQGGKIAADTRTDLGRAGIGVGVRAGAPKPDISTPEAMKRTLLKAHSIAFNRDGASAVYIHKMVERLGIADKVKPQFMPEVGAGQPQRDVAAGKAEMVITLIPEIAGFAGLDLVGPLPGDLQSYVLFAAGVAANSRDAAAAKSVIQFISAASVGPTLKSRGVETRW